MELFLHFRKLLFHWPILRSPVCGRMVLAPPASEAVFLGAWGILCLLQSDQKDFAPNGPPSVLLLAVSGQSG